MKNPKKSIDQKRWLAMGIAVVLFVLSSISQTITNSFVKDLTEDKSKSLISNLFNPQQLEDHVLSGTNPKKRILIVPIHGVISAGSSSTFTGASYNHDETMNILKTVEEDPTIKGIILDVDSPGGGVYESAELHKAILDIKKECKIPIYSSMGSVAASGGYYISAPADKIYASAETVTGSIGVIMQGMNVKGLMDKLGIQPQVYKSGAHKDMGSGYREPTEEERSIHQEFINSAYQRFVTVVTEGRKMDRAKVLQLADGRIYDGEQAVKNGLVDEIGYLDDAVAGLTKEIGGDDPQIFVKETLTKYTLPRLFSILSEHKDPVSRLVNTLHRYEEQSVPKAMYLLGGDFYE